MVCCGWLDLQPVIPRQHTSGAHISQTSPNRSLRPVLEDAEGAGALGSGDDARTEHRKERSVRHISGIRGAVRELRLAVAPEADMPFYVKGNDVAVGRSCYRKDSEAVADIERLHVVPVFNLADLHGLVILDYDKAAVRKAGKQDGALDAFEVGLRSVGGAESDESGA